MAGLGLLLASGLAAAQAPTPVTLNPIPDAPPPIKTLPHKIKPHEPFAGQREPVQQAQHLGTMPNDASTGEYQYLVEPPGADNLFKRDSEADFQVRLQNEWRDNGHKDRLTFPDEPVLSTEGYLGRAWPQYAMVVEPTFVAHRRLLFEQPNYERYGWDMGILDSPLSAGAFFGDFVLLPYHSFTDPFRCLDTGAGYCLPGDPVPLLLYPQELSASGAAAEAAAVLTVLAVFP